MAPLTRRGRPIARNLKLRRSLIVGLKELVRLDARPVSELDRFLPDARPDRCGPTEQFMTLRCPHCFVALREFGQEATLVHSRPMSAIDAPSDDRRGLL
jgi:hypothetical protein